MERCLEVQSDVCIVIYKCRLVKLHCIKNNVKHQETSRKMEVAELLSHFIYFIAHKIKSHLF